MNLIAITDGSVMVHFKTSCTIPEVAKLIPVTVGYHTSSEVYGQELFDVLKRQGHKVMLSGHTAHKGCTGYFQFTVPDKYVYVYNVTNGRLGEKVFNGTLAQYLVKQDPGAKLREKMGKLVRFTYTAGSKPNSVRVIYLDEVKGTGPSTRLVGRDVGEPKGDGFAIKSFLLSRIKDSKLEVLN